MVGNRPGCACGSTTPSIPSWIRRRAAGHVPVRICGDMVDLLWRRGRQDAALSLGDAGASARLPARKCSILCAYSAGVSQGEGLTSICDRHSHAMPPYTLASPSRMSAVASLGAPNGVSSYVGQAEAVIARDDERARAVPAHDDRRRGREVAAVRGKVDRVGRPDQHGAGATPLVEAPRAGARGGSKRGHRDHRRVGRGRVDRGHALLLELRPVARELVAGRPRARARAPPRPRACRPCSRAARVT